MTTNDILTLAQAGFTAQQIAALGAVKSPAKTGTFNEQLMVNNSTQPSNIDLMSQQIAQLTQAVQAGNLMASNQPAAETADDVLASIINPPNLTGGDR